MGTYEEWGEGSGLEIGLESSDIGTITAKIEQTQLIQDTGDARYFLLGVGLTFAIFIVIMVIIFVIYRVTRIRRTSHTFGEVEGLRASEAWSTWRKQTPRKERIPKQDNGRPASIIIIN
eukprot:GFUD01060501.1.p1 GENE.GFUD01060501.1~~GFUD01060501.1.p1  ORF type:complete len:119 (+),score=15.99 GFUD01060501.1:32-388(+)